MTNLARGEIGFRTWSHLVRCLDIGAAPESKNYGVAAATGIAGAISEGSI
jgi:hypothetical protein